MMKSLLFFLGFYFSFFCVSAQSADTTQNYIPKSWDKYFPGVRLAMGWQKSFYYEAGLSLQKYGYHQRHGYAATCFYIAFERTTAAGHKPVNGFKAGVESVFNGATWGLEIKHLKNSLDSSDVVITPKIGIGIGAATLFYGYNLSTNKEPFDNVGSHQFSLAINTNILFHHLKHKE